MRRGSPRRHDVPARHRAAAALDEYVEAAGLEEPKAALFQSVDPAGERLASRALTRRAVPGDDQAAHRLRRAAAVDVLRHVPGDGDHGLTSRTGEPRAPAADHGRQHTHRQHPAGGSRPDCPPSAGAPVGDVPPGVGSGGRVAGRVGDLALPSGEGGRVEGHGTGPRGDLVDHGRPARGCRGRARSRPEAASG